LFVNFVQARQSRRFFEPHFRHQIEISCWFVIIRILALKSQLSIRANREVFRFEKLRDLGIDAA